MTADILLAKAVYWVGQKVCSGFSVRCYGMAEPKGKEQGSISPHQSEGEEGHE